jgi:peroxiredoxin
MVSAGQQAPGFELEDLEGRKHSLAKLVESGPVVLAFFKVSCPVCQLTAPYLERIAAGSGARVVGISQDNAKSTLAFNERYGIRFPVLLDGARYPVSDAYGIFSVPTIFVIEPGCKISQAFTGFSKLDLRAVGERAGAEPFKPDEKVPEFKAG